MGCNKEEATTFKTWIQEQIGQNLMPLFKANGYKKGRTNTYIRERNGIVQFVSFELSREKATIWWGMSPVYFPLAGTAYCTFPIPPEQSKLCSNGIRAKAIYKNGAHYEITPEAAEQWHRMEDVVKKSTLPQFDLIDTLDMLMAHAVFSVPDNGIWNGMKCYVQSVYECLTGDFDTGMERLSAAQMCKKDYLDYLSQSKAVFGARGDQISVIFSYIDLFCNAVGKDAFLEVYKQVCDDARQWYKVSPASKPISAPVANFNQGDEHVEFILNEILFERLEQLKDIYRSKWNFRFCTRYIPEDAERAAYLEQKWGKKPIPVRDTNLFSRSGPVPAHRISDFETKWEVTLPGELRDFLTQYGEVHFDVDFTTGGFSRQNQEGYRCGIALSPKYTIEHALLDISLEEMEKAEECRQLSLGNGFADDYYSCWEGTVGLTAVPNGDVIAVSCTTGKVVYLSHDGDESNGMILGSSLNEYVSHLLQIGLAGNEGWMLEAFMTTGKEGIDPDCTNARLFRQIVGLS